LIPRPKDAEDLAAVAEDKEEFLCDSVLAFSGYNSPIGVFSWDVVLSVRSSNCAAVVNICGGS
jgi:hypothetical protein